MTETLALPVVLLLTPSDGRSIDRLRSELMAFVDVGLRGVIVRERHRPQSERSALVADLTARMRHVAPDAPSLVALASPGGGHPTHLRSDEAPSGGRTPWGRSCHTVAELEATRAADAAWATFGPYAASISKPGYGPVRASPPPAPPIRGSTLAVYALGGITSATAASARRWSGHGVATLGAVWQAEDPARALGRLLDAVPSSPTHPSSHTTHDQGEAS